jgi:serine phosphatase RsbU (regulator of sigma subunit)
MTDQTAPLQEISPEHLRTLYSIMHTMNSSLDFDEVLNNVIESVMQVTRAERGFLLIGDERTGELQSRVARGVKGDLKEGEGYSTTIVNQVVETRQSLLTNNAQGDDRYTPGQSIIIRGLRAVLCAPMLVHERLIGVVYVDTTLRSGSFSEADRGLLSAVAGQAGIAIENARLYRVAVEKGRLEQEFKMAREIQESLLPYRIPQKHGYELTARWRSAREMAGDFYDVFPLGGTPGDEALGVVIADVSDKGAPAALFMAVSRSLIRGNASAMSPVDTLWRTNELILDDARSGMFVTVFHSVFHSDGHVVHVNAGHNPPVLYRHATREISFLPRGGRAIGWFADIPLSAVEQQLEPGDVLLYYTDGLTEAENREQDYFSEERLVQALLEVADESAEHIADHILGKVDLFCGDTPPIDDLTLFIVRYTG